MWMIDEALKAGESVTPYKMATRLYFLTFASDGIAMVVQSHFEHLPTVDNLSDDLLRIV